MLNNILFTYSDSIDDENIDNYLKLRTLSPIIANIIDNIISNKIRLVIYLNKRCTNLMEVITYSPTIKDIFNDIISLRPPLLKNMNKIYRKITSNISSEYSYSMIENRHDLEVFPEFKSMELLINYLKTNFNHYDIEFLFYSRNYSQADFDAVSRYNPITRIRLKPTINLNCVASILPSQLKTLTLQDFYNEDIEEILPNLANNFPKELTHLEINRILWDEKVYCDINILIEKLPFSQLEKLSILDLKLSSRAVARLFSSLPPTLTELLINVEGANISDITIIFPNDINLNFMWLNGILHPNEILSIISKLPSLTSLIIDIDFNYKVSPLVKFLKESNLKDIHINTFDLFQVYKMREKLPQIKINSMLSDWI